MGKKKHGNQWHWGLKNALGSVEGKNAQCGWSGDGKMAGVQEGKLPNISGLWEEIKISRVSKKCEEKYLQSQ